MQKDKSCLDSLPNSLQRAISTSFALLSWPWEPEIEAFGASQVQIPGRGMLLSLVVGCGLWSLQLVWHHGALLRLR